MADFQDMMEVDEVRRDIDSEESTAPRALNENAQKMLNYALTCNRMNYVRSALELGADPNCANAKGLRPLHIICNKKMDDDSIEVFFKLCDVMQKTVHVDAPDGLLQTPLHYALFHGLKNASKYLLSRRADPNFPNKDGLTALHVMCRRNGDDEDDLMTDFFGICDNQEKPVLIDARDKFDRTPLYYAVLRNQKKVAKLLLKRGAHPNLPDKDRFTPLHVICTMNDDELLRLFFDYSTQPVQLDAWDKLGQTPLHYALSRGCKSLIKPMLERGADPCLASVKGSTPLHLVCHREDVDDDDFMEHFFEVCYDVRKQVNINAQDGAGGTPLHWALYHGHERLAKLLLARGADPNVANDEDETPLFVVCNRKTDDADLAKILFDSNRFELLQVNSQDRAGNAPLLLALTRGHARLASLLLGNGADPNVCNLARESALHVIIKRNDDDDHLLVERFFEICKAFGRTLLVDVQDATSRTALHHALSLGLEKTIKVLLRAGANPNLPDVDQKTYLHYAASRATDDDDGALADFLSSCRNNCQPVDVDARDHMGWTPLHHAVHHGHTRVTELLLRGNADPNVASKQKETPLHVIVKRNNDDELMEHFFKTCQDVKRTVEVDCQDEYGQTPLQHALRRGHQKLIGSLLRRDVDLNLSDQDGCTPLHVICQRDHDDDELLKLFFTLCKGVKKTVEVEAQDKMGCTPLHHAVHRGLKKITTTLLKRGVDPNLVSKNRSTALHVLCQRDKVDDDDLMKLFFKICKDVKVDVKNDWGQTALHHALFRGHKKLTATLLKNGADPNVTDKDEFTPLHVICQRDDDSEDLLKAFFKTDKDVKVDVKDKMGWTPLHHATLRGHKKLAAILLKQKSIDPNAVDNDRSTPLHVMCKRNGDDDDDLMKMFFETCKKVKKTVLIDSADSSGSTPLHLALENGHIALAKLLLKRRANPNVPNREGETPLHVICRRKIDDNLMKLFLESCDDLKKKLLVDVPDATGRAALHRALHFRLKGPTEALLKYGADPNLIDPEGLPPLRSLTSSIKDDGLLEKFLEVCHEFKLPVEVNVWDSSESTPLHYSTYHGLKKVTELLLILGADPNWANADKSTPLHLICNRKEDDDLIEIFFEYCNLRNTSVLVNVQDNAGNTPLHLALTRGHRLKLRLLLAQGVDANAANNKGETPLHIICKRKIDDSDLLTQLLFSNSGTGSPVLVNAVDFSDQTPLQLAARYNLFKTLEILNNYQDTFSDDLAHMYTYI